MKIKLYKQNAAMLLVGMVLVDTLCLTGCSSNVTVQEKTQNNTPSIEQSINESANSSEEKTIDSNNEKLTMINLPLIDIYQSTITRAEIDLGEEQIISIMDVYAANNNYDMPGDRFLGVRTYINQDISSSEESGDYMAYNFDLTVMTAAGDITINKGLSEFWINLQPTAEHEKAFENLVKKPVEYAISTNDYSQIVDLSNQCINLEDKSQFSCLSQAVYNGLAQAHKTEMPEEMYQQINDNSEKIYTNYYISGEFKKSPYYQNSGRTR